MENNYDGQGKSQPQETDDSLTMLCLVMIWTVFCVGLGLALWLTGGE